MAEQISHNVVNRPESTSGSLVDAAVNDTNTVSAPSGTTQALATDSATHPLDPPKSANQSAPNANATASKVHEGLDAAKNAAEPSAGEAAHSTAQNSSNNHAPALADKIGVSPGESPNALKDDASLGEGPADDRSTADVSVDVSVNSDTDNSRADAAEKKDGSHHVRTNSVKKPTTFSKVTATKNFMNKIAPSAPATPKVGEKPSPVSAAVQPINKPRLIAKTGASLANLQKSRSGSVGASGPDGSKVWNKNRPVQPPPPRQFTDEELKQQYGIHLATRLQSDEAGKDSKWADIDDDEDDWAPEAVVWMDGTKSTVTPQDSVPPPKELPTEQKEQKPAAPPIAKPPDGVRPILALKGRSGEAMKILKPGSGGSAPSQRQDGLTAASPGPEKAGLKSKSPAPAPTKSPWAPVPKVDSVSPINPPVQQQQQQPPRTMPSQDVRSYESAPPPPREIAADTFDRSWKEGEGNARELFNSTNGRYEPAPEGRGSSRVEPSFRKPALLQRPSQVGVPPAEPSATFQSRTATQMDGSWGRRRGSSVSQGSMPPPRRMSMNQRPDLAQTPEMPHDMRSPQNGRVAPAKSTFAQQSQWDQQMPPRPEPGTEPTPPPGPPAEDPVEVQERVMREKRELAKKRRQEEEAREEDAKQERLKAKLAALEGAGKSKKEREAEAAAAAKETDAKVTPTSEKPAEHVQPSTLPEPAIPAATSAVTAPSLESQSRPPAPAAEKPPQMQPLHEKLPSPLPPKPLPAGLPDRSLSNEHQQQKQAPRGHLSPRATNCVPYQQPSGTYKAPTSSYSSPGDRKLQPSFGRSPNLGHDAFSTPWPTTAPNGNVWGTSGIGNGTFENSSSFAPVPMSQQSSALPPPPGMGRPSGSARISPQSFAQETRSPSLQHSQVSEQQRALPPPGMDSRPEPFSSQPRLNGVSPAPGAGRPVHPPGPIGPPSRTQQQPPAASVATSQPSTQGPGTISAWNNAAASLPNQYSREIAAAEERRRQQEQPPPPPAQHRFRETFKKTSANQGALGGPRKYDRTEYTIHDAQGSRSVPTLSPAPPATQTQPPAPFTTASPADPWRASAENTVRMPDPSRNPTHMSQQPPIAPPSAQQSAMAAYHGNERSAILPVAPVIDSKDQSPPPPENEGHPVNDGANHPHVRLPRPQAKVKLPPSSSPGQTHVPPQSHGSVMMPQRPWSNVNPPGAARAIVHDAAWQARFNGLFNRTPIQTETPPSPPKTPPKVQAQALAVAASSRNAMDEQVGGATVALPQAKKRNEFGFTIDNSSDRFSKPIIDEMFKQEQSFGSTPKVRVPRNTKYNTAVYGASSKNMLQMPVNSKFQKQIDAQSSQEPFFWRNPEGIFVTIPHTRFDNKLIKHSSIPDKSGNGLRKPHARNNSFQDRAQDRKASGRSNKNKSGKESNAVGLENSTNGEGRNDGYQKPSRQPSNVPVTHEKAASRNEGSKNEQGGDKRKSGWGNGGRRGGRSQQASTAPTPVKAN
ncbi:Hypothetical predicted protein [Lecanosticta acicola]|uniref:Uncharacterized protein n=1 Tax=Lecanosticta acicola TaxID=111012 RepID=A0AAI8Z9F0_9PEZI|nr:Hypothetical predicted protein [Lecanosticta acicola]